jgi:Flp pilus assembly protein TadD
VPHDAAAERKAADSPAGKSFPYPGETAPDAPAPKPDDASSGSSSGSSSSSSSENGSTAAGESSATKNPDDDDDDNPPKLTDKGSEGRRVLKVVKPQSDEARVDEDLSVAKFYGQSGNYMGAYLRAKDAVKTQPDYPEGHFALGEAAKRLKKKDEAAAEFREYLKLSPDGEKAKAAEKALAELQ